MVLKKLVYSTGKKEFKDFLNVMRLFYGESHATEFKSKIKTFQNYIEDVTVLETDVDDVSGEILGNFIKILENKNVLDIQILPSITKKNRPGHLIKVLCHPQHSFDLIETIFSELGTLGVRFSHIKRVCVDRRIDKMEIEIDDKFYELNYKISYFMTDKKKKIVLAPLTLTYILPAVLSGLP